MTYLFVAYAICWALTFAFLFSMAIRLGKLQRELEALQQALGEQKERS
ncbi:MAG: CcmD family protein [Chloroflexi bacterium]|nr:CcmD family protein [Chloroflexota bacterium]